MASTQQRVALVTGANRGIGREVARQLVARGVTVVVGSRDVAAGQAVAEEIATDEAAASAVRLDVTAAGAHERAIADVTDRHGCLDILVNNAGRLVEADAADTTASVLRQVFETNVFGVADMIRASLPSLRRSAAARIVNVTSTTGSLSLTSHGTDFGGNADQRLAYSTSKAALNMLTIQYHRAFRLDDTLRHIKINSGTPGYTATDMNEGQGTRTVEQGARIIVELALLPDDGPSGGFFNDDGPIPW